MLERPQCSINQSEKIFNVSRITNVIAKCYCEVHGDVVIRVGHQGMLSEIDTSSVVDETESTKVTTESQMAECSAELMRRPETTDGRWIPAGMQECLAGVTLMNVG